MIQPVRAAIELRDELLAGFLVARIVQSQLFHHATIARGARIDRVEAEKRPVAAA
jgi:hypothetical protein